MLGFSRGKLVFMVAVVAITLALGAGVLVWQTDAGRVDAQDAPPAGEESSHGDRDDKLGNIGGEVAGFGGMYFEAGNENVLKVYLTDPNNAEAVEDISGAIAKEFPDVVPAGGIEVVQGAYSMSQLVSWYDSLRTAIAGSGLVGDGLVFTDLNEGKNRLEVAVDSEDAVSGAETAVSESGVPSAAVIVTVTEPVVEFGSVKDDADVVMPGLGRVSMDHQTILDKFRPLFGGLKIRGKGTCTMGFNAVRAGVDGFVTNSHCSKEFSSMDSSKFYQPTKWPWNKVGKETVDASTYRCSDGWAEYDCRRADASFIKYDSNVSGERGKIARTIGNASHTLSHDNPRWRIVSDTAAGQVGQSTVFVGVTSGTYTPAVINNACIDIYRNDRDVMMVCQTRATAQGTGGGGNSGAPVFKITDSPDDGDVHLYGIVWGGNDTTVMYSSVQQIQHSSELGTLRSCASPFTC